MNYIYKIERAGACKEAVKWLRKGKYRTLEEAWENCKRSDWMYWLMANCPYPDTAQNRKKHRLLACEHAWSVLPIWEKRYPDDHRPRLAIEAAERYARKPTEANATARSAARIAALSAAVSAADSAAAGAAWSAARIAARSAAVSAADSAAAGAAWSAARSAADSAAAGAADSAAAGAADSAAAGAADSAARIAADSAAAGAADSAARIAARSAAWSAADSAAREQQADAIRRFFPKPPKLTKVGAK